MVRVKKVSHSYGEHEKLKLKLAHGKMIQRLFILYGRISFCCENRDCEYARKVGTVVFHYVRIKIIVRQNTGMIISMRKFGFEKDLLEKFKVSCSVSKNSKKGKIFQ